ncbi:DUF433 domain-containing protein [Nostoc flagelliforme FACHB-838]|uniref:DUF433 domain-containing protein n=1 Tax=Nostoc flagelliforme FACHB-838 TaxID=2692904 RepID=A0ABR8DLL4_9NOSO|nr:DUF433 domain-containing protein [Nostoc flagelliforme FACHB-838]
MTQIPGQCGGRPCIRGMRIRVSDILEMLFYLGTCKKWRCRTVG